MPHCPYCGQEMLKTDSVCPNCGQAAPKLPGVTGPTTRRTTSSLPLGEYLKTGWELFKRYPGGFIGFSLLYFLIQIVLTIIPLLGWVASGAVSPVLLIGYFIVSAKMLQGCSPHFSDFFLGFRFFVPLLLTGLVGELLTGIGWLFLIIPGVYLMVSYLFATSLVVDRRLDFWQALELSRGTVNPIWFGMFGFFLLLVLVNLLGLIALFVGLLVSLPVSCCAVTAAYADLFGLQSDYSEGFPDKFAPESEISAP